MATPESSTDDKVSHRSNNSSVKPIQTSRDQSSNSKPTRAAEAAAEAETTISALPSESRFASLPTEILTQIATHLSTRAPSSQKLLSEPQYNLTNSPDQPLKSLSQTNHLIRSIVLPLLFVHVRLDPYQLSSFLDFITTQRTPDNSLSRHVTSATARLQGPCSHIQPTWWTSLLDALPNLNTVTVLAAPHVFAEIGQVSIETTHSWAFKIPYHCMTLTCDPRPQARATPARTTTSKKLSASASPLPDEQTANTPSTTTTTITTATSQNSSKATVTQAEAHKSTTTTQSHIFLQHSWKTWSVNESSHLPAYSTYEYFLKLPPSLLTALYQQIQPQAQALPPPMHTTVLTFLHNLETFTYAAVFPFYNHVDEVLKLIRHMVRLKRLKVKLCPEPESTVLQDELERNGSNIEGRATEGRIDVNDPWNEFDASYTLIPHTIIYLTTDGALEEFQTDDVKMIGIRDTLIQDINRRLEGLGCWHHTGDGIWKRDMKMAILPQNPQRHPM